MCLVCGVVCIVTLFAVPCIVTLETSLFYTCAACIRHAVYAAHASHAAVYAAHASHGGVYAAHTWRASLHMPLYFTCDVCIDMQAPRTHNTPTTHQ